MQCQAELSQQQEQRVGKRQQMLERLEKEMQDKQHTLLALNRKLLKCQKQLSGRRLAQTESLDS